MLYTGIISAEMQQARRKDPSQLDSWDLTMRAHWHIRRFTRDDMAEARRLLEEATQIDPANAMAVGDLSFANHFRGLFWLGRRCHPGVCARRRGGAPGGRH